jgi:hypothetical protein
VAVIDNLSSDQVTYLTMNQIRGFSPDLIEKMKQILSLFSKDQLSYFSSDAIGALSAHQLLDIYNNPKVGLDLTYLYPSDTASAFNVSTVLNFKEFIDNSINAVFNRTNFDTVKNLPDPSLSGLRKGQTPALETSFFKALNASQTYYLLPDTLMAISGPQYAALTPDAIAGINPMYIKDINPDIYSQLTCDQIKAINDNTNLVGNITDSSKDKFNSQLVSCTFGLIQEGTLWIGFGISAAIIVVLTVIAVIIISRKPDYNQI